MTSQTYTNVILTLIFLVLCWAGFQLSVMNDKLDNVEANTGKVVKGLGAE